MIGLSACLNNHKIIQFSLFKQFVCHISWGNLYTTEHQSKALDTANAARIADSQLNKISDKPLNFAL
ncbi:MAG: hypothetical protein J6Q71_08660, partial [Bacteroidales bacterium]|nr:hypothetical protein [Bacteroidales bacterium]